nr:hypothetical protein CFP56_11040 [Quercus suber]
MLTPRLCGRQKPKVFTCQRAVVREGEPTSREIPRSAKTPGPPSKRNIKNSPWAKFVDLNWGAAAPHKPVRKNPLFSQLHATFAGVARRDIGRAAGWCGVQGVFLMQLLESGKVVHANRAGCMYTCNAGARNADDSDDVADSRNRPAGRHHAWRHFSVSNASRGTIYHAGIKWKVCREHFLPSLVQAASPFPPISINLLSDGLGLCGCGMHARRGGDPRGRASRPVGPPGHWVSCSWPLCKISSLVVRCGPSLRHSPLRRASS